MKKKIVIILFSFFFALSVQQLSACCCGNEQFQAYQFEGMVGASFLETAEPYNGDRSGRFVGDPLATLSDGSQWKVHPDNKKRFFDWQQGDKVYILPRTSFYWFKREHKFKMYNATKDQYIKVMFIRYPSHARYIQAAEKFLADSRYEPYEYF